MKTLMDPGEVRFFVESLRRNSGDMAAAAGAIKASWTSLSSSGWDDLKAREFGGSLEDSLRLIGEFLDQSERYADDLIRKATLVEEYQDK